jgi:hypothetical protein
MNKSISRIATSVAAAALSVGAAAGTAVATTARGSPSPAGRLMTKVAPTNGNGIRAPISYASFCPAGTTRVAEGYLVT